MENKKNKQIIYIGYAPLTEKTAKDFFISDLEIAGNDLEYWDLSGIYFKGLPTAVRMERTWIIPMLNLREMKNRLNSKSSLETIYIINFPYSAKVLRLFQILTKANSTIYIIARGMLPIPVSSVKDSITKLFKRGFEKKVYNFIANRLAFLFKLKGYVKPFDRIYFAGEDSLKIAGVGYQIDRASAELIPVNSADYDSYLQIKDGKRLISYPYAVFLDEYLPFHPDAKMFGLHTVEPDSYYTSLNFFFKQIEEKYKLNIIIAAHPKAVSYQDKNYFEGREVIFYKSAELIRDSEFVLAQRSTAISLAVLFKKMVVFMHTDYMQMHMGYYYFGLSYMANELGSTVVNIDSQGAANQQFNGYDQILYDKFKYGYLTSVDTEGMMASEIFLKSLKD